MGTFKAFNHTADIGLEVAGEGWEDLLATAAEAMFEQILEDWPRNVEVREEVCASPPKETEDEASDLLVAWLQELLFRFEKNHLVPIEFAFRHPKAMADRAIPPQVCADVAFSRFDPNRHRARCEVKAVTYHGLQVRRESDGTWSARLILDV